MRRSRVEPGAAAAEAGAEAEEEAGLARSLRAEVAGL